MCLFYTLKCGILAHLSGLVGSEPVLSLRNINKLIYKDRQTCSIKMNRLKAFIFLTFDLTAFVKKSVRFKQKEKFYPKPKRPRLAV